MTSTLHPLNIPQNAIAQLCQDYHICKLALFGSILGNDFHADSDIDILVEFHPGKTPGLEFVEIQDRLSQLFGRPVDLNTPQDLSHYFREQVLANAKTIYG